MEAGEWSKIIPVFIASAIKPGLVGLPASVFAKFTFSETLLVCGTGGICGSVAFSYLSEEIIILYEKYIYKRLFPNKKRKVFSRQTRFLVRVKHYFGITGIAAISPLILSIPLGSFVAVRFFGHPKKTAIYMGASSVIWTVILYFVYNGFYDKVMGWFK
jgi:hypothetical protein